jgi:putative membrane protein insertion efficiency factor
MKVPSDSEFELKALPARAAKLLIRVYQITLSPMIGNQCRFHPSCSNYAMEAVDHYGAIRGSWLALKRLGRCHPFHAGGFDPVPGTAASADRHSDFKEI